MEKGGNGKVIAIEKYQLVQKEIAELREQLEEMILKRQRLIYDDGKDVEMDYMRQIGHLEYQLLQYRYQAMRARRQEELMQQDFARTSEIDREKIQQQLDNEFRTYRVSLAQWEAAFARAKKRSQEKGIDGELREYNDENYTYYGIADIKKARRTKANYTVYRITIRDDLLFSDGQPITIDDVIFSLYAFCDNDYDGNVQVVNNQRI